MNPPDHLPVGVIVRAHGVRGGLRVRAYDAGSDALERVERVLLVPPAAAGVVGPPREARVESAAPDKDGWLVHLEGTGDRDAAEALRGAELLVRRAELGEPDDDEVYVTDLVGCEVVDAGGARLGRVREVQNLGAGELLVVELDPHAPGAPRTRAPAEALLPFVEPIVVSVDLEQRRIVCDPPEGLLDPEAL